MAGLTAPASTPISVDFPAPFGPIRPVTAPEASFTDAPGGSATWTFTGGTNYNDQAGTADIAINKANATVTVNGYTGTYDALSHGATGTVGGVAGDLAANGSALVLGQ